MFSTSPLHATRNEHHGTPFNAIRQLNQSTRSRAPADGVSIPAPILDNPEAGVHYFVGWVRTAKTASARYTAAAEARLSRGKRGSERRRPATAPAAAA